MKNAIVLKGVRHTGKTTSVGLAYEELKAQYRDWVVVEELDGPAKRDFAVIGEIKGKRIGICSQGDDGEFVREFIKLFIEKKCGVILCVTRTRGQTRDAVIMTLGPDYQVTWVTKEAAKNEGERDKENHQTSADLFAKLQRAIADQ